MKKTKLDYIREGREFFLQFTDQYMPAFGLGASWQAKAFAEGWRIEYHLARDREEQEARKQAEQVNRELPERAGFRMGAGAISLDGQEIGTAQAGYIEYADSVPVRRRLERIYAMVKGYMAAALWSTGATHPHTDEELEDLQDFEFSDNAVKAISVICGTFYDKHTADLGAYVDLRHAETGTGHADRQRVGYEFAGHDLWLTSAGHGSGFWDRGMGGVGKRLSDDCGHGTQFSEVSLYLADDLSVNLA